MNQARNGGGRVGRECCPDPGFIVKGRSARLPEAWMWAKQERGQGGHEDLGLRAVGGAGVLGSITGICTAFQDN